MEKTSIAPNVYLYPLPCVVVGALVDDQPNYLAVASLGIFQHDPPVVSISMNKCHYSNCGIKRSGTFSLNVPTTSMAVLVDHVGIVSGRSEDKSGLFTAFYGELGTAPMAAECPVNLECRLLTVLDYLGSHEVFVGQVVASYADPGVLTDGVPDPVKLKPLALTIHDNNYWQLGAHVGEAWSIGRRFGAR